MQKTANKKVILREELSVLLEGRGSPNDSMGCFTQFCSLVHPHGLGFGSVKEEATTPKRMKWHGMSSEEINMRKY